MPSSLQGRASTGGGCLWRGLPEPPAHDRVVSWPELATVVHEMTWEPLEEFRPFWLLACFCWLVWIQLQSLQRAFRSDPRSSKPSVFLSAHLWNWLPRPGVLCSWGLIWLCCKHGWWESVRNANTALCELLVSFHFSLCICALPRAMQANAVVLFPLLVGIGRPRELLPTWAGGRDWVPGAEVGRHNVQVIQLGGRVGVTCQKPYP